MELTLNLLPPRLIALQEEKARRRRRSLLLAAAAVPVILAYLAVDLRIAVIHAQIVHLDRRIAPLLPIVAKVREIEADRDALRRREDALAGLTQRSPHWSLILMQLSSLVPPDVWFTNLRMANGRFIIQGRAFSTAAVSTLSGRLADAQFMRATSLKFIREESPGARRTVTFEMSGVLHQGRPTP